MKNLVPLSDLIERIAARNVEALGMPAGDEYVVPFPDGAMRMDAKEAAATLARQEAKLFVSRMIDAREITPRTWTQLPAALPLELNSYSAYWLRPDDVERALIVVFGKVTQDAEKAEQAAAAPAALVGVETKEARQKRRYDQCIAAGLQMPSDDYSHLPTGIGELARAENISTAAYSKDVKAYIAQKH